MDAKLATKNAVSALRRKTTALSVLLKIAESARKPEAFIQITRRENV